MSMGDTGFTMQIPIGTNLYSLEKISGDSEMSIAVKNDYYVKGWELIPAHKTDDGGINKASMVYLVGSTLDFDRVERLTQGEIELTYMLDKEEAEERARSIFSLLGVQYEQKAAI